jgi:hypothetical protein
MEKLAANEPTVARRSSCTSLGDNPIEQDPGLVIPEPVDDDLEHRVQREDLYNIDILDVR